MCKRTHANGHAEKIERFALEASPSLGNFSYGSYRGRSYWYTTHLIYHPSWTWRARGWTTTTTTIADRSATPCGCNRVFCVGTRRHDHPMSRVGCKGTRMRYCLTDIWWSRSGKIGKRADQIIIVTVIIHGIATDHARTKIRCTRVDRIVCCLGPDCI